MTSYKAYLIQDGDGCDYTIGCAQTVIDIPDAEDLTEAELILKQIILDEYGYDETMLESATLFEINDFVEMDVERIYEDREELLLQEKQRQIEKAERLEYERLKSKFE